MCDVDQHFRSIVFSTIRKLQSDKPAPECLMEEALGTGQGMDHVGEAILKSIEGLSQAQVLTSNLY